MWALQHNGSETSDCTSALQSSTALLIIYETVCHTLKDNMRSRVSARQAPMHSLVCHLLGRLVFKECYSTSVFQGPALGANPKFFLREEMPWKWETATSSLQIESLLARSLEKNPSIFATAGLETFTGAASCTKKTTVELNFNVVSHKSTLTNGLQHGITSNPHQYLLPQGTAYCLALEKYTCKKVNNSGLQCNLT